MRRGTSRLTGQAGQVERALLWLALGLAALVLLVFLVTPELAWDPGGGGLGVILEVFTAIGIAAVPGLAVVLFAVGRRRRRDRQEQR